MEQQIKIAPKDMPKYIITSLIEADVTKDHIQDFLTRVKPHGFLSVAVDLPFVDMAVEFLKDVDTHVTTVSSYPLGGMTTETKLNQVAFAREHGVFDIDVSMNYFAIKSGKFADVEDEVRRIMGEAQSVKVVLIPQVGILTNNEKAKTVEALLKGGCTNIKTGSGFGWTTEVEDVVFLKRKFGDDLHIEVAGGVRTYDDAMAMMNAGAEILHSSTAFKICGIDEKLAYQKQG